MPKPRSVLLRHLFSTILVLFLSIPIIALVIGIQSQPTVPEGGILSPAELSKVEELLLENAPRSTYNVSEQLITLNEADMNLLLRYGLSAANLSGHWAAELSLQTNAIETRASIGMELAGYQAYLNLVAAFTGNDTKLQLTGLKFGSAVLPNFLLDLIVSRLESGIDSSTVALADINTLLSNIQSLTIDSQQVEVALQWDPVLMSKLADQTQQLFVSDQERLRVGHYYRLIADIITATPLDIRAISLNTLLIPLFQEAQQLSLNGSDPIAENRAVFQALAVYVNEESIEGFVGKEIAKSIATAKPIEVRLLRRQDLAKHLTSIASITSSAGAELASMVSTTKEAYDARYRSGFSFSDLAANTVGVTLATLGTQSRESANRLQTRIIALKSEEEYMPTIGNNRDGISESDFAELYTDRNSDVYLEQMAQINELVRSAPLFSDLLTAQ